MTPHKTKEIKQRPVTYGMTADELQQYTKMVHEEQHGNPANAWDCIVVGYRVEKTTLSDDLEYRGFATQERKRIHEDHEILAERCDKRKQIKKLEEYIEKLNNRIKQIQADKSLSVLVKQKKIQNCLNRIAEYQQDLDRAKKFLEQESARNRALYEKYMNTK